MTVGCVTKVEVKYEGKNEELGHKNYLVCEGKERDFSYDVAESYSVLLRMKGD
jgi:hypothetical protein